MSTLARQYWLKVRRRVGRAHFRSVSGLGLPYVCHLGDFGGEAPFYCPTFSVAECAIMAAWCSAIENPIIFDIGANNGFVASQVAQLLRDKNPKIYAFEPVPSTFMQLKRTIESLGLNSSILPICTALSDEPGIAKISYDDQQSIFAQIAEGVSNPRVGTATALTAVVTVDAVIDTLRLTPSLLKIDVEGFEPKVLRGARKWVASSARGAVCLELNPTTLNEVGSTTAAVSDLLEGYRFYYLDDFEGQRRAFGEEIPDITTLSWVCNLFALPEEKIGNWTHAISKAKSYLP